MVEDPQPYVNMLDNSIHKMVRKVLVKAPIIHLASVLETVRIHHPRLIHNKSGMILTEVFVADCAGNERSATSHRACNHD